MVERGILDLSVFELISRSQYRCQSVVDDHAVKIMPDVPKQCINLQLSTFVGGTIKPLGEVYAAPREDDSVGFG